MIIIPRSLKKHLPKDRYFSPIEIAVDIQDHLQAKDVITDTRIKKCWGLDPASKRDAKKIHSHFHLLKLRRSEDGTIQPIAEDIFITRKRRILTGKRLDSFNRFWEAFDYKTGKAEAADAWLDIPLLTNALVEKIVAAAKQEAERRPRLKDKGGTPKMAQGWLSAKRWEDERYQRQRAASQPKGLSREQIMKLNK